MVYGPQSKPGEKKLHIIHISSMSDWGFPTILVSDVEDKTQIQHLMRSSFIIYPWNKVLSFN